MAFQMSRSSLFAILLRSPWWYSVLISFAIVAISMVIFDGQYLVLGIFCALPFLGIAGVAGYKRVQQPSQKRVLEVSEQVQKMPPAQIAQKIADCYIAERYESAAFQGNAAELTLTRGHRKLLVSTRRCKVGNTGVEPLKQLVNAGESAEATGYLYVALGSISAAAREYANSHAIELIQAQKLAAFFDAKVALE